MGVVKDMQNVAENKKKAKRIEGSRSWTRLGLGLGICACGLSRLQFTESEPSHGIYYGICVTTYVTLPTALSNPRMTRL